jgi:hypothetical protein
VVGWLLIGSATALVVTLTLAALLDPDGVRRLSRRLPR